MMNDKRQKNDEAQNSTTPGASVACGTRDSSCFRHSSFVLRHSVPLVLASLLLLVGTSLLALVISAIRVLRLSWLLLLVGTSLLADSPTAQQNDWPMFRGNSQLTGVAGSSLPEKLSLQWTYEAGGKNEA